MNPAPVIPLAVAGKASFRTGTLGQANGPLPAEVLSRTVLVIEDEALIAWMVESLLQDLGFAAIVVTANADEARHAARETPPGLIVSDINLGPGVPDGIETVASLPVPASIPVVFVTAHADPANIARIDATFPHHAIICKPVSIEPLNAALRGVTGLKPLN